VLRTYNLEAFMLLKLIFVICSSFTFSAADADPSVDLFSQACHRLEEPAVAKEFVGAKDFICLGASPHCSSKTGPECGRSKACAPKFGSSSGPGCSPCLPDMVYQSCVQADRAELAKQILKFK
jgi:hypothetical protein